ncbi:hypothetical protein ES703_00808 [subsurface metagenome]
MDPVRTIQGVYQREGRVPSIRQLVKAGVRKAEVYEKYSGLRGLCEAAGVPLPEQRYERVGAAMKSPRRGVPRPITEEKPSGSIYKERPYAGPVQQLSPQQPYPSAPPPPQPVVPAPSQPVIVKVEAPGGLVENGIRSVFEADARERKNHDDRIEQLMKDQEELGQLADNVLEKMKRGELSWQKKEERKTLPPQPKPQVPRITMNQAELIVEEMAATKVSKVFAAIEKAKQDKLELEAREIEEAGSDPATHEVNTETEMPREEPLPEEPPMRMRILPILRSRRRLLR